MNNNNINDRRQYYRIDDNAIFSYSIIDENTLHSNDLEDLNQSSAFEIIELFGHMNQQMKATLGRICEHSPDIVSYLRNLDNKVELLAQICLLQDQKSPLESRREINLGAGGLAFGND